MREREDIELRSQIEKLSKEAFELRFKSATEAVASPARFTQIRRDVARLNTILAERAAKTQSKTKASTKTK
ncbi:MAG: 50S ribosomal protein L29 [Planctomycetota bacterium]